MPAAISKLPLGILGFLGIKNGGQYPQYLSDTIAPTWDQLELLVASQSEQIFGAAVGVAAAGTTTFTELTVPQTEVWYCRCASLSITTSAGMTASQYLALRTVSTPGAAFLVHPLHPIETVTASLLRFTGSMIGGNPGWFMGPGEQIAVRTVAAAGGTVDYVAEARILRMAI